MSRKGKTKIFTLHWVDVIGGSIVAGLLAFHFADWMMS